MDYLGRLEEFMESPFAGKVRAALSPKEQSNFDTILSFLDNQKGYRQNFEPPSGIGAHMVIS